MQQMGWYYGYESLNVTWTWLGAWRMMCRTSQNLQKASTFSTHSIHPFPIFPFDHPSSPYYKYYLLLLKARTAVIIFTKKSTEHLLIKITLQTTLLAAKGNLPPFSACYQELFALQQLACCVYCPNSWNRLKRCWETSF